MIIKKNIFYSKRNKNFFSTDEFKCRKCGHMINKHLMHFYIITKKNIYYKYYHPTCLKKVHNKGLIVEKRFVLLVPMIPEEATLHIFRVPKLSDCRDITTFQAASAKFAPSDEIIDKTNHCHNKDFMKDPDYVEFDKKKMIQEKDTPLIEDEGLNLLDEIAKSKPVLTSKEKKMLEEKS